MAVNFSDKVNFIWSVANLIRDPIKRGKYQDVILPFTVLRRLDCVLAPTKQDVLTAYNKYHGKLEKLDSVLTKASGFAFYNTSKYDFETLLDDALSLAENLRFYINSFSPNMREVIERFDFYHTIDLLDENNLLYLVVERFTEIDLHPHTVPNEVMGYIFEELIRKFNEALDENPGEHFTPREVIQLMVNLVLAQDRDALAHNHIVRTVYDPCCGTGGMLTIAEDHIQSLNELAQVYLFGQEVNPETYAVCKADLYMKDPSGQDAENIALGSTLSNDQHDDHRFDYLLANPPYGKDWKMDRDAVEQEYEKRGYDGRFGAGTPRISDGQLLFLQHMLSRMKSPEEGGSRIAIVMNGSPLFTGDAGSGESEIRRWILENDWLDAIVALPEQLFYNTGIATYVWVLTNRKEAERVGKVQLIDATDVWVPMRKSLGDKRREISPEQINQITQMYMDFSDVENSKIFDTADFGYRKIRVERPLRVNFIANEERIERLWDERAFQNLASSRKRDPEKREAEIREGEEKQAAIIRMLQEFFPDTTYTDCQRFRRDLEAAADQAGLDIKSSVEGNIINALSERDEHAEICRDDDGNPEYDTDLRDHENVPLKEDIFEYFEREVLPYVPDAWIDEEYTDDKDGKIGRVGYEINFNRYFYKYQPPRPLEEIEADIKALEEEIINMLREVTE